MIAPPTLRVLVASGVRHASTYLPVLRALPGVAVAGLLEDPAAGAPARADSRALAEAHEVPYLEDPAALGRPDVDVVMVCSEPVRHARLTIAALEAGKHVIVDKPMAVSLDDATAVLRTAERAPGRLTVVNRLAGPGLRRARGWIDAGQVGFPRHVDVELLSNGSRFEAAVERPELVADPTLSGGGEIQNFMCYAVDAIRYLTGCEPVSIYAESGSFFFDAHRRFGVEDLGLVSLELEHGVTAAVLVGRVPQTPTSGGATSTVRLIASHGHLVVDDESPLLEVWRPGEPMQRRPIAGVAATDLVTPVFAGFFAAIRDGSAPFYGPGDGWASVAAVDAAYRSLALGQPVSVGRASELI
ncbi:MAG: Gfo/Idh/MocA family protein [Candidatus Dormibacteraceae bacterium]